MQVENNKQPVDNYEKFLKALEINELNLKELAYIMGYSYETMKGFSMPNRESPRARNVSDRFIEFMNMKLLAHNKKPV